MRNLPLGEVYKLIEPGPVILLTTARGDRHNVMTMSWHMMVEFEPPLIACVLGGVDYSFATLDETGECVIAIPPVEIAEKVVGIGNCSGKDTDKFSRFGLTAAKAKTVAPPLIAECFANLECRVADRTLVQRYGLFILEVTRAWIDPAQPSPRTIHHRGCGNFAIDGEFMKLASRMR